MDFKNSYFYYREEDLVMTWTEELFTADNIKQDLTTAQKMIAFKWAYAIAHIEDVEEAIWT